VHCTQHIEFLSQIFSVPLQFCLVKQTADATNRLTSILDNEVKMQSIKAGHWQ